MNYQAALDYLYSFGRFGSRPGLERMNWFLERLGHPQRNLRFIHIAGTNGKGSTTAFVHGILRAAGYRVGMYTSPYLEMFTNRIGANGADIPVEVLAELMARVRPLVEEVNQTELGPTTQFEVTTVLALLYYQQLDLDFVVWEVGLGGRLDATNVVTPLVSVITNIGMDHTDVLGDTLARIAAEKAGIIKPGVPVVTAVEEEEAWDVIRSQAESRQAPIWHLGENFSYVRESFDLNGQMFTYRDPQGQLSDLRIALLGEYQCRNAATAIAAVRQLEAQGFALPPSAYRDGLAGTRWAGRLEIMSRSPLIVVDGAHNPHGTLRLQEALAEFFPDRRIVMVLGILKDKQRAEMLEHLLPLASRVWFTAPQFSRGTDPAELLAVAKQYPAQAAAASTVEEALAAALAELEPGDLLLVAGSLYVVAEAREYLKGVLPNR